jgi:hypothetical protein
MSDIVQGQKMPVLKNLHKLNTLEGTREFFQEVIEIYTQAGISENNLRAMCYALKGYLGYWTLIKNVEIEERLDAIEERLDEANKN